MTFPAVTAQIRASLGQLALALCLAAGACGAQATLPQAPFAAVVFDDDPGLDAETLLSAYQDTLGQVPTAGLIERVQAELVRRYRAEGYLDPAPRLVSRHDAAGILVMEMREPRVDGIHINGREHLDTPEFVALIRELRAITPLRRADFADWLARANARGYAVRGNLVRSSSEPHLYVAILHAEGRRWHGIAHVDNRGPEQFGHEIAQVSLGYRWPRPGLGQIRLDVAAAAEVDRLRYAGVAGAHQLRDRGDGVRWKYARSKSQLPTVDGTRHVDYDRERAELAYALPLTRQTRKSADLTVGLRSYDLDQQLDDGRDLRQDRIRAIWLGYRLVAATENGQRHEVGVAVDQGIDALGASLWPDGADQEFTVIDADYTYRTRLGEAWMATASLSTQFSDDRLPNTERFFVGGRELGGAFDPATLSGDRGLGARARLQRALTLAALSEPLTAYAYYDHGWVWSNDDRPADDAGSAGIGVSGLMRGLSWELELGIPVQNPETPTLLDDDPRVFFSLTQRF